MFEELYHWFFSLFRDLGIHNTLINTLITLVYLVVIILLAWLADVIGRRIIHTLIRRFSAKTATEWDDIMVRRNVFRRISNVIPALVVLLLFPRLFAAYPYWIGIVAIIANIYLVIITVLVINSVLNSINDIYQLYDVARNKPIRGYIQIFQILVYLFALVLIVAFLIGKNPLYLLTGLGAFMAILVLVFKDPIQGLVASIQLSANDMVRIGDWITIQKFGADGEVMEITLASVKIRNFDNTIVSIPTYSMITDSFQNWRGMQESDGRRFKRSIYLDMNSARFVDEELLAHLRKFRLIREYIDTKQAEINQHNLEAATGEENPAQYYGRRQTNLGIFRAYIEAYLRSHPEINTSMTLMVRQLAPTEKGIPVEVYAFSRIKEWEYYERLQSDLFDHIISIIPEFDLRIFQEPSGRDMSEGMKR
ncbi:MAG TPA: mechanosensitive ion channel [Bacteroidales bacterium]|nr:mechanosensitive ion channel [Bacteroidales bacterium]